MSYRLIRTLRTHSSERFLIQSDNGTDVAAADLHYLDGGNVEGTLITTEQTGESDGDVQALLEFVDETLLPMASLDERNLCFTIVKGTVIGRFENEG